MMFALMLTPPRVCEHHLPTVLLYTQRLMRAAADMLPAFRAMRAADISIYRAAYAAQRM